ncbi:MJ1255/VC2487 family glycosyltransferase [Zhongshania borealis]|uniref:Glycosyltransferase family protein n=1 Tax=Zhongshania borealis TaxID=889488 RepID=A0ABP7X498_9GAMM
MKLLYGIQGTGNGHISRARMMAKHFAARNVDVQYLFSGRAPDQYFDMAAFGDYLVYPGLSFATDKGRISNLKTLRQLRPIQFIRDLRALDLSAYDAIISDFEPLTAWAGRLQNKAVIGIGHQYAFAHDAVPENGADLRNKLIMRYFAPTKFRLGLHWDRFNGPIAPPIINPDERRLTADEHILVYLPFEDQQLVSAALQNISKYHFIQYSPDLTDAEIGNVSQRKTSLHGFKHDLCSARAVICNAGFELISECLHMGIPALAKPVSGQGEQLSNATALKHLKLADVMDTFSEQTIAQWLQNIPEQTPQHYPDVAEAICDWVLQGQWQENEALVSKLWQKTGNACSPASLSTS